MEEKLKSLKFIQYHAINKVCIIFNQNRKKNIYCHTYKQGYKEQEGIIHIITK